MFLKDTAIFIMLLSDDVWNVFFSQNKKRIAFSLYEDCFHTWDKKSHEVDQKAFNKKIMRRNFFDLNTTLMAI